MIYLKDSRRGWGGVDEGFHCPRKGEVPDSDITNEFVAQKYGIELSFICLSLFNAMFLKVPLYTD